MVIFKVPSSYKIFSRKNYKKLWNDSKRIMDETKQLGIILNVRNHIMRLFWISTYRIVNMMQDTKILCWEFTFLKVEIPSWFISKTNLNINNDCLRTVLWNTFKKILHGETDKVTLPFGETTRTPVTLRGLWLSLDPGGKIKVVNRVKFIWNEN